MRHITFCWMLTTIFIILITGCVSDNSTVNGPPFDFLFNNSSSALNDETGLDNNTECSMGKAESSDGCDWKREVKRTSKRQTPVVGWPCWENIDCQTQDDGAFCDTTKKCTCLPARVSINGYCWPKRNLGEPCTYKEQCTSTSANSYCAIDGICKCLNDQNPILTDDGPFCISLGECPTNGMNSKLRDSSGTDIRCGAARDCKDTSVNNTSNAAEDAYYCLCPTGDPEQPDCDDASYSYCCPRRAISCIQPRDEGVFAGGGSLVQTRWWYHSATGQCESMTFRGQGGNGNNFQSKELCETYCKTTCTRGNPGYSPGRPNVQTVTKCSTANNPCKASNLQCLEGRSSFGMCCPTRGFICGPRGGVHNSLERSPDSGDFNYNIQTVIRYYYNSGRCLPFVYHGFGGNFNNFQTEEECLQFCTGTMCSVGDPLRDSKGDVVKCENGCPSKYTCTSSGACCPSVDFVCSQPKLVGGCSSYVERWWFNQATRNCEKFHYSGCQSNFNNFQGYRACVVYCGASSVRVKCPHGEPIMESNGKGSLTCADANPSTRVTCPQDYYCHYDGIRYGCCPTRTKTCSVDQKDFGTACVTPVTRWYYNAAKRECDIFQYNGCDGNSNNFATKIDCQDYCAVGGCPDGGEPYREPINGQFRPCGTSGDSDCPEGYLCTVVTLDTATRRNYCCPTRVTICSLTVDQGRVCGTRTLNRYFFNVQTRICEIFTYNGCSGNRNNFATQEQCLSYCSSAACPRGQVALQNISTGAIVPCDPNMLTSCRVPSYTCVLAQLLGHGICCGSSAPAGSCPAGQTAYVDSFTNSPLQCQPNIMGSCPNGIFCRYSGQLQNAFCCGPVAGACSHGGSPYTDPITSQSLQCTVGLVDVCPGGYMCQPSSVTIGGILSTAGYCCKEADLCGPGYSAYHVNNQPVPCVLAQAPSACPSPSSCRQHRENGQSYCCVMTTAQQVCSVGKQAYLSMEVPTLCTPSSSYAGCPAGYTCDLHQSNGNYYCCRIVELALPIISVCPPPYTQVQPIITCSPNIPDSCPINSICLFDTTTERYVCCGYATLTMNLVSNPCPNGRLPYVNPVRGQPQICILGRSYTGCPLSYSCAYSSMFRNYYCCGMKPETIVNAAIIEDGHGCPYGTKAYLYPNSGIPLACHPRSIVRCPPAYTCRRSIRTGSYQCCSSNPFSPMDWNRRIT